MGKYNVLVTGVGAIIGYGIVKSLRETDFELTIVGSDIYDDAVGRFWCDEFIQAERSDSDCFEEYFLEVLAQYSVDLVIPGIEQDVAACAGFLDKIKATGAAIVMNSRQALSVFEDKLETYRALDALGLPGMNYVDAESAELADIIETVGVPCIHKKKVSYAGKGLKLLETVDEVKIHLDDDDFLFQQYIESGQEYTISVFGTGDGTYVSPIAFMRTLGPDGATHKVTTHEFDEFRLVIDALCAHTQPEGPTNFQFIENDDGDRFLLEVNPRVSSSTSLREKFGVNEAEMCIEYFIERKRPSQRQVRSGSAQRYIDEVVEYDRNNL